ncbi:MAG: site-2 protease family protein, partial [Opitutus sp.]
IAGIPLSVHFSFFLLLAFVAQQGWNDGGWSGAAWNTGMLLVFFACVVLHELGHSLTARRFGVQVRRILLMPIGGMAEFDSIPRQPGRELLITVAGPAVNFLIAGMIALAVGVPAGWPFGQDDFPANATGFLQLMLHWNLLMGVFNLVPVFPMDGGRIFRAMLATRMRYVHATFVAATVGKVLAGAGVLAGLFYWQAPLVALLFGFIFFAGELEYRAVKRREVEDAHFRAMMARFHTQTAVIEEPPVLSPPETHRF